MSILDIIYPKFCLGCGKVGTYCCSECLKITPQLRYLQCPECERPSYDGRTHIRCQKQFGLDGVFSLYPYVGIVKNVIKGMKYRFAYRMVLDLFHAIPKEYVSRLTQHVMFTKHNVFLLPIPLHASRRRERGFNQAAVIAKVVSTFVHVPVNTSCLERSKKTLPQVNMKHKEERMENMKQAFTMRKNNVSFIYGASVILVDDVYTTGSTLKNAALVLKQAGARFVFGLTIAQ